jgi:hypothetical protein
MAARRRTSPTRPRIAKLASGLPRQVYAQASPRSQGGVSLFAMDSVDAVPRFPLRSSSG